MTMATGLRYFLIGVLVLGALVTTALMEGLGLSLLAATIASVLIAVGIHAAIVGAGFLLAWRLSHRRGGAMARGFLRAWPGEVAISLRNMYLDIPWRGGWRAVVPAQSRGAILLVHGYGCNRGVWRGFFGWLGSLGYTVDAIDLSPPQASIDDFGKQVLAGARDLCQHASVDDVIIIAHSMGGLAARAALRHDPNAPIRHVITIATPHQGTYHARMGRGICATEMVPDGPWLTQLNAALPVHDPAKFSCVASRHDNIVSPLEQALLPGAQILVCERVGHMRLMYHPAARRYIAARLEAINNGASGAAPGRSASIETTDAIKGVDAADATEAT